MRARIATGVLLAAAAGGVTWWAPAWLFAAVLLAVLLAVLAEWNHLTPAPVVAGVVALGLVLLAAWLYARPHKLPPLCLAGALLWLAQGGELVREILRKPTSGAASPTAPPDPLTIVPPPSHAAAAILRAGAILLFAWSALVWLRLEHGAGVVIAVLLLVAAADTGAYFIGRRFGKRKLAAVISPGKTIEGLIGGCLASAAVALLAAPLLGVSTPLLLAAAIAAALAAAIGDLFASRLKRRAGAKDSGRLLPGHGGLLDRLDGHLAAAPAFAAVWLLA